MSESQESYPNFEKLLQTLLSKIKTDGVSLQLQKTSDETFMNLKAKREIYFRKKIFYDHVVSIILGRKCESLQSEGTSNDPVWETLINSTLYDLYEGNDDDLFGLSKESFVIGSEHRKFVSSIKGKILSNVESSIQEQCDVLVDTFNQLHADNKSASHHNLPSLLNCQQTELIQLRRTLNTQKVAKEQILEDYFKCLRISCNVLLELLSTYRLDKILKSNSITLKWMLCECEALYLKIKMQELQLLNETYTKDSVKALNVIRKELHKSDIQTSVELAQKSDLLSAYESVGQEFKVVVEEFAKVRDEIENKTWALREVERHKVK